MLGKIQRGIDLKMITVNVSGHLKEYTGKKREFQIPESSVRTVLDLVEQLDKLFPGIKERILDDQDVTRQYVNIFVNGEDIRFSEKENTKLKEGDKVHILPSVAGGS
jgi:molybdopterin synthase sulfur carrier subunit